MARKSRSEQQPTHANSPPPNATNARKRKFDFDKGFEVRLVQPGKQQGKLQPPAKKRKLNDAAATSVKADVFQPNPFEGSDLSDAHYNVLPRGFWEHTDRYRSFTIEKATFAVNQIVFIKADRSQDTIPAHVQGWVAKILEVRASDPSHVFLRVYWLYRPEDLPRGRQPYHGASELIASNDMAIIDALTVESEATVIHWAEKADQGEVLKQDQLFWRQTYDVVKGGKLSDLPEHCIEKSPCNPDDILVQCEACSSWLHGSCLEEDAVREAYKSHDIPFPEDQPKARGRPPKKGAKKRKSDFTAFSASIKNTTSGKTRLTVTDQRPDQGDHWNVAVKCLLCKATIEEALNEEETKPREPTPLFENQQQDVDDTQDNIILGARPNDDDEDSVLGKSQEEPQESAAAPARDRTALNSAKDAPPKKENDWLSKMLQ